MADSMKNTLDGAPRALSSSPVSPAKLAHVALKTPQLKETTEFYTTLLNGTCAFSNPMMSLVRYDDEHHRLAIIAVPLGASAPPPAQNLAHVAFTFGSLGELLSNYARLRDVGILPAWSLNHGGTISMYYPDPDNNMVELQVDAMPMEEVDALLQGEYFAINPIGVDIDPEVMLERYLRGDPLSELLQYGSAPYASEAKRPVLPGMPDYDWKGEQLPSQ